MVNECGFVEGEVMVVYVYFNFCFFFIVDFVYGEVLRVMCN